jgi:hypothetical protein
MRATDAIRIVVSTADSLVELGIQPHRTGLLRSSLTQSAHRRSLRRLTDRLDISSIVFLSLDKRLHVGGRDQADRMAKLAPISRAQ